MPPRDLETKIRAIFKKILRREVLDGNFSVREIEEWNSLSHINLVIALETEFGIDISPDDIAGLYSDFNTVIAFLEAAGLEQNYV
ncbi:acyl carrier protein [Thermodesulfobacteriota bacterium]